MREKGVASVSSFRLHESSPSSRQALVVMARSPVPGKVKTRLAAELGPESTAQLYAAFIADTLEKFCGLPDTDTLVFYTPGTDAELALLRGLAPTEVRFRLQRGDEFGQRLLTSLQACAAYPRTVVIGTDSPSLPVDLVVQAFAALAEHDLVVGPAMDGGYYLLGVHEATPELFSGIEWSTSRVLEQTVVSCRRAGCTLAVLPPWYDVDDRQDLDLLIGHLAAWMHAGRDAGCPRTVSRLRELLGRP